MLYKKKQPTKNYMRYISRQQTLSTPYSHIQNTIFTQKLGYKMTISYNKQNWNGITTPNNIKTN